MSKPSFVVDTNVAIVANFQSPQASGSCVLNCVRYLDRIKSSCIVVLDESGLILKEYRRYLSPSGQQGVGDAFFKWLWQVQADPSFCENVVIRPDGKGSFYEFPNDPALTNFDLNDHKFVAVAKKSVNNPKILNAVDTDWWEFKEELERNDVYVENLCPDMIQ